MWEESIDINRITEIRVKTTAFLGVGAIRKMAFIAQELASRGVKNVLCVTGGKSYKTTGAFAEVEKACKDNGIAITLYDKVTPNPTTVSIDEAAALGIKNNCTAVIAIGGGSPLDAGKSAALILANPDHNAEEIYTGKFAPTVAAPIIAVNLTHGTGSEVDRFAVATVPHLNYKPAVGFDCLYPLYAIDDPALMASLPPNQTRYVSIDAVNHCLEGATSKVANPLSIELAVNVIYLVAKWLPKVLDNPNDLRARYFLAYAALLGGTAFDNGLLHITHALEHPLSALKPELAHGLGLSMIVPAVVEASWPGAAEVLALILQPIVPGLKGTLDEAKKAAKGVEDWLKSVGVPQKLSDEGFDKDSIPELVKLVHTTPGLSALLDIAPVEVKSEKITEIYTKSMKPMA